MTMISVISNPPGVSIHSGRCRSVSSGLTVFGGRGPPGRAGGAGRVAADTSCPVIGRLWRCSWRF